MRGNGSKSEEINNGIRHGNVGLRSLKFLFFLVIASILLYFVCTPGYLYNNWRSNRGHVKMIGEYFDKIRDEGYEVDPATPPRSSYTYNTTIGTIERIEYFVWRARLIGTEQWVEYSWELYPVNTETFEILKAKGIPVNYWWKSGVSESGCGASSSGSIGIAGYKTILIPTNGAALEVHKELGLRLPENFTLPEE